MKQYTYRIVETLREDLPWYTGEVSRDGGDTWYYQSASRKKEEVEDMLSEYHRSKLFTPIIHEYIPKIGSTLEKKIILNYSGYIGKYCVNKEESWKQIVEKAVEEINSATSRLGRDVLMLEIELSTKTIQEEEKEV